MSQLEELCQTLTSIDQQIVSMAREVFDLARRCAAAAQSSATAARNAEDGGAAARAAAAFGAASQAASRAAALLNESANQGRAFVARTVGSGGTSGGRLDGGLSSDSSTGGGLSGPLQSIYDSESFAFSKGPGRFFLEQHDRFRAVADTMPRPNDGSYLAMIHGAPNVVGVGSIPLSARDLADLIRHDPNYTPGQPITLFSCETGRTSTGVAQQLADEIGVPVVAPTSLAWLPPQQDGSILVTPQDNTTERPIVREDGSGYGGWRRFTPRPVF